MAFAVRNLSVLAYAQGFTLWHYRSEDALDRVVAPEFFADASDMLAVGDMMMVSATDGGQLLCFDGSEAGLPPRPLGFGR